MFIDLTVEQRHIDEGETNNCKECPIAKALSQYIAEDSQALVYAEAIHFYHKWNEDDSHVIEGNLEVSRFVDAFDNGHKVKPFTTSLNIPAQYLRPEFCV